LYLSYYNDLFSSLDVADEDEEEDEEAMLLELQSTLLGGALSAGTTSELQSTLDEIESRRKIIVNKKMARVQELSKQLNARRSAEKMRRKGLVLDAADRKAMEQREKNEREEKLAQARYWGGIVTYTIRY
jgi:hypothetical protein